MESTLIVGGIGVAAGLALAFALGSEGGEKAVLIALAVGAGYALARYGA